MKFELNKFKKLIALLIISTALTACGSGDDESAATNGVGGGVPGYNGGSVVPTPGGGMQISFSGSNIYNSNILLSGGYVAGSNYCGWFSYNNGYLQQNCWLFSNNTHFDPYTGTYNSGQLVPSSGGIPALSGGTNTYTGTSLWEAGASITVVSTVPVSNRASITGAVVVPPNFISRNPGAFPQGSATPIVGLAIDMGVSSNGQYGGTYKISGGVLIYTSGNQQQGYHGAYLRL